MKKSKAKGKKKKKKRETFDLTLNKVSLAY
jgi:hypothetical protein